MGKAAHTPKVLPKPLIRLHKSGILGNNVSTLSFGLVWVLKNQVSRSKLAWVSKVFYMLISNSAFLIFLEDVLHVFLPFANRTQLILEPKGHYFVPFSSSLKTSFRGATWHTKNHPKVSQTHSLRGPHTAERVIIKSCLSKQRFL